LLALDKYDACTVISVAPLSILKQQKPLPIKKPIAGKGNQYVASLRTNAARRNRND